MGIAEWIVWVWVIIGVLILLVVFWVATWIITLIKEAKSFLVRAHKTLNDFENVLLRKDAELKGLIQSATLATAKVEAIVAEAVPVITVLKKIAVTADDLGLKGTKAVFSLNSIVSRLITAIIQPSRKEK